MNNLFADVGYVSLNHVGEELCGDMVEIIRKENELIVVLADGLGSGVKANILSTLTSKIISTMMAEGMSIEDCVSTVAATLPVCMKRGVAYSTFTIMRFIDNREVEIIQFDNPKVILLRDGKNYEYLMMERVIEGKKIYESKIALKQDDVFIAMSDGAIYAGVGQVLNYGWQRENIIVFAESNYNYTQTAKIIASTIADECNNLYAQKPGDDTTILAVQIRKRKSCNLIFGPPEDPSYDNRMLDLFFSKQGKHIVCGGTTSKIVAKYLGREIITHVDYTDPTIPPSAEIEGVDLVTEGVITLAKVLDYAKNYLEDNSLFERWGKQSDAASFVARILFKEATDVNLFVGKAQNEAHQHTGELDISFSIKMKIIEELKLCLEEMGKTVIINYF